MTWGSKLSYSLEVRISNKVRYNPILITSVAILTANPSPLGSLLAFQASEVLQNK